MSNSLQAGFARVEITPKVAAVPLAGFGATEYRLGTTVVDPLFAHLIALKSGEESCLYICMDLVSIPEESVALYREAIGEATGLSGERIFICGTHTHAGPDMRSELPVAIQYREVELKNYLVDAAKRAVADLKPAKLSYGTVEVGRPGCRLTFDRHYYAVPIEKRDNYTDADLLDGVREVRNGYLVGEKYAAVKHVEEADHRMHLLRFEREAADDILMVNFSSHSTFTGGTLRPQISSDYSGAMINRIEEMFPGTKCAFLQGCAGNLVPCTEIGEEGIWGVTYPPRNTMGVPGTLPKVVGPRPWNKSHYAYGAILAGYAYEALISCMKDSETDLLAFRRRIFKGKHDHSKDHLVDQAKQALELYKKNGHSKEAYDHCAKFGLGSIYSCGAIISRASWPEYGEIELNAIRIGDCAIVTAPFENYCSSGQHVKAESPFAMTVFNAYSCGAQGYLPNKNAHPLSYEGATTHYELGTAEKIEQELNQMLNEIY